MAEKLFKQRVGHRSYFTKLYSEIKSKLPILCDQDLPSFLAEIALLEDRFQLIDGLNSKILDALSGEDEICKEIDLSGSFMHDFKLKITELKTATKLNENAHSSAPKCLTSARLPKLSLVTFDGTDVRDWPMFWDTFKHEVHSQPLSDATKFRYLMSCLKGKALARVHHFSVSKQGYPDLVDKLEHDFGDSRKIKQAHIDSLNSCALRSESVEDLRTFFDLIQFNVKSLQNQGLDPEHYGDFVVPSLLRQLPAPIQMRILDRTSSTLPTLDEFLVFFELELNKLENLEELNKGLLQAHIDPNSYQTSTVLAATNTRSPSKFKPTNRRARDDSLTQNKICVFCNNESHITRDCTATAQTKYDAVVARKLCFRCLGHHFSSNCPSMKRCVHCKGSHHSSLHSHYSQGSSHSASPRDVSNSARSEGPSTATTLSAISNAETCSDKPSSDKPVLLKTARAQVFGSSNTNRFSAGLLFDEGSQLTYISEPFAAKLKPTAKHDITMQISAFGGRTCETTSRVVEFDILTQDGPITTSAVIVRSIVDPISQRGWAAYSKAPVFQGLNFADSYALNHFEVDILIGSDQAWRFIRPDNAIIFDGIVAQDSSVGYLLSGSHAPCNTEVAQSTSLLCISQSERHYKSEPSCTNPSLSMHQLVDRMFHLDHLGVQDLFSSTANEFDMHYRSKISFSEDEQQYVVPLPWKIEHPPLATNLPQSRARLKQLRDRLVQLELFDKYAEVLQNHEMKGYIERVPVAEESEVRAHYLPHFFVLKPQSSTTPLRIVFAANSGKVSLNDCFETGPCLLNNLIEILVKFRFYAYAFSADIAKAFLNIVIAESDRDFLRFVWFENNEPNGRIIHLRYRCLNFGPTCAPYILNATLRKHLEENSSWVTADMHDKLYVDNLVSGTHSEEAAVSYYSEANCVCAKAKMPLRQWLSNSPSLMSKALADNVSTQSTSVSVLGVQWDANDDLLRFPEKQLTLTDDSSCTKRTLLSKCSSLFDPFGFLTPIVMPLKFHLSLIWEAEFDWDDPLPNDIVHEFEVKLKELQTASDKFSISRPYSIDHTQPAEIHLFCDASSSALGCVIYLVQGEKVTFVMSKLQIISKKKRSNLTIPKSELMAMLLGAKLLATCLKYLKSEYPCLKQHCWTDSEICLHWLNSISQSKVFIRNRVNQIRELTDVSSWSHVSSEDNPADIVSRGSTFERLSRSRFYTGPSWLTDVSSRPPQWSTRTSCSDSTADIPIETTVSVSVTTEKTSIDDFIDIKRFSSYHKVLATVSLVLRFCDIIRHRIDPPDEFQPTTAEIFRAEQTVIRLLQDQHFSEEKCNLYAQKQKRSPLVRQLNLIIDEHEILHAAGRLSNANIEDHAKCPILLPKTAELTKLIIRHYHVLTHHGGLNVTLSAIREQFWIPCGRTQVKNVLRSCVTCLRQTGRTVKLPERPALPSFRVNDMRAFSAVGIDFSGHLMVRDSPKETVRKVYFCIFACCTTRNINVELVDSMSTESFLLAFRAHCADFSIPNLVICDNAPTFKKSANEIHHLLSLVWSSEVSTFFGTYRVDLIAKDTVEFRNIPVKAPWWGGFYERCVGLVKLSLKKTLGRACISSNELRVLLKEIRSTLNDRPITYVSSDDSDLGVKPLSPSLLLYGHRIRSLPHAPFNSSVSVDSDHKFLSRCARQRALLYESFVKRFQAEYFSALRERHSYQTNIHQNNDARLRVGDVCLISDSDKPRTLWKLAVIESLHVGGDDKVRAVSLRTSSGLTNRAISKLVPLEIRTCDDLTTSPDDSSIESGTLNSTRSADTTSDSTRSDGATKYPAPTRCSSAGQQTAETSRSINIDSTWDSTRSNGATMNPARPCIYRTLRDAGREAIHRLRTEQL